MFARESDPHEPLSRRALTTFAILPDRQRNWKGKRGEFARKVVFPPLEGSEVRRTALANVAGSPIHRAAMGGGQIAGTANDE